MNVRICVGAPCNKDQSLLRSLLAQGDWSHLQPLPVVFCRWLVVGGDCWVPHKALLSTQEQYVDEVTATFTRSFLGLHSRQRVSVYIGLPKPTHTPLMIPNQQAKKKKNCSWVWGCVVSAHRAALRSSSSLLGLSNGTQWRSDINVPSRPTLTSDLSNHWPRVALRLL